MHYLIIPHFLSDLECDELIAISKARGMALSTGFDVISGTNQINDYRTSSNVFLPRQSNLVIQAVENRIAMMTGYPWNYGEDFQVVRYSEGQYYRPHHDYHDPAYPGTMSVLARGGQRVMTVLIYLNTLEEGDGGATGFPRTRVTVVPEKGKALVFWNVMPDGRLDESTYHEGLAPKNGKEKWICTKWLHEETFY
jgi:prolyl 4-hydroxylase